METSLQKSRWEVNLGNPKNEDDPKNKDDLQNEGDPENKYNLENEDDPIKKAGLKIKMNVTIFFRVKLSFTRLSYWVLVYVAIHYHHDCLQLVPKSTNICL